MKKMLLHLPLCGMKNPACRRTSDGSAPSSFPSSWPEYQAPAEYKKKTLVFSVFYVLTSNWIMTKYYVNLLCLCTVYGQTPFLKIGTLSTLFNITLVICLYTLMPLVPIHSLHLINISLVFSQPSVIRTKSSAYNSLKIISNLVPQ